MNDTANFFEAGYDLIPDLINQDANADLTGDRICVRNYERAYAVLMKPAGSAGDDLSLQLNQATAASSGSTKALTFNRWWYKIGTMTSQDTWTAVEEATATADLDLQTPTDYLSDVSASVIVVEVRADSLDLANGYSFVYWFNDGTDIGNALVLSLFWILKGNRYAQKIPLTALS